MIYVTLKLRSVDIVFARYPQEKFLIPSVLQPLFLTGLRVKWNLLNIAGGIKRPSRAYLPATSIDQQLLYPATWVVHTRD